MPLGSTNAKNAVLNNSLSGTDAPANLYLALYNGSPTSGGTEMSGGNYARQTVTKGSWSTASGGAKANGSAINFPAASGWTGTVTHAALVSTASGAGDLWDNGPLGASITVSGGTAVSFAIGALQVTEA